MHSLPSRASALVLRALSLTLLAGVAQAQLDLPSKLRERPKPPKSSQPVTVKSGKGGSVAPHLVCAVCGDRNYTTPIDPSAAGGVQEAWCNTCTRSRPHSPPRKAQELELPSGPRGSGAPGGPGAPGASGGSAGTPGGPDAAGAPGGSGADVATDSTTPGASEITAVPFEGPAPTPTGSSAEVMGSILPVWEGVAGVEDIDDPVALRAVPTILAFGESGLVSARGALSAVRAPVVLTAARVLLRGGNPADADMVVARLRKRMPGSSGAELLAELGSLDPVRATPRLYCELLDHAQYPVRSAAERALATRLDPSVVPLLAPVLESSRGDARYRAVDLLARIDDPSTTELLIGRVADPRAKVAWRACEALARSTDDTVEDRLLVIAFGDRWILREAAYAVLALVEREDYRLEPVMGDDHVPALLRGLSSSDPFVSGACASALAGIGFRSARSTESPWLDRDVPERLVATVVGDRFFDDYSSLQTPALRRLKQIAGVSFGSEGPKWAEWWLEHADRFRASRAVLSVDDGAEGDLEVRFQAGGEEARAVVLLGPDRAESPDLSGEVFYLNLDEARDFLALLHREGALGSERLPGVRGGQIQRGRKLEIRAGEQSKTFAFGPGVSEPWFERATQMLDALIERNLWQRFPHPAEHMGSRRKLWEAEHEWWRDTHDELERAQGFKGLILGRLPELAAVDRESDLDELERLYREPLVPEISDFTKLLELMLDERFHSSTARKLTALARRAAGLEGEIDPSDTERVELAWQLITLLHDQYDAAAGEDVAALLQVLGPDAVRAAASDERPLIRAIAATILASSGEAEDRELLLELLSDPDPGVEVAAVIAAGREKVEEARIEIVLRARGSDLEVKMAALRALGHLGGEHALDALIGGLGDGNLDVRVAAAEGLSELSDPSVSSLLVSLLRQGSSSAVFDPARRGLLNLGEAAWDDLFAAMRSSSPAARRESALLLSHQACPDAASTLMRILTENPEDIVVANELSVLTCIDFRHELDPADAWWSWWDDVRHDDAMSWFLAAAEARDIPAPDRSAFQAGGTEEGIAFLIRVMAREEAWLVERARRELIRTAGRDIGSLPARGVERDVWLGTLYEVLTDGRD